MDYEHKPLRSSTGSLPMRAPVAMQVSRKYKSSKSAAKKVDREMALGRLKSVRKATDGIVVTFYMSRRSSDWHKWAFDAKEAAKVRKAPATEYVRLGEVFVKVSRCRALVKVS